MRNLKKILAMVLALVMSLSLMATASAGSFPDVADDNIYHTAITVLDGLKVIQGYEDGEFKPQNDLTRAQAAVLVYRIVTGDVDDDYVANYTDMAQSKFTDLAGYNWARGYINYCQNAKIIMGKTATTFDPGAQVTGYQLMAMILRAMGYGQHGEFEGSGWELRTAAIAEQIGILKGIAGGDGNYGEAASRALVSQILFNAMLTSMADYNALLQDYVPNGKTLGYEEFGLEEIEGVVVANEFANLNTEQVLTEGKTQLQVADETSPRTLNISSTLEDIGESRYAYTQNVNKVLALGDTGKNVTKENDGVATDISTSSKFQAAAGMPAASDIEYYVDFDRVGTYTCDQRLEFSVTFQTWAAERSFDGYAGTDISRIAAADNANLLAGGAPDNDDWTVTDSTGNVTRTAVVDEDYVTTYPVTYHKIIRADLPISQDDMDVLYGIFGAADNVSNNYFLKDGITGDVFVGTVSTDPTTREEMDLSNSISYNTFVKNYINDVTYDTSWVVSWNGEWVKFIDNDNDGRCDYAFLTTSCLDEVVDSYTKDGETVLEYNGFNDWDFDVRYLDGTPNVGDKILFTYIDNQVLVELAKDETVTVSSYSWRDDEITTDKGTYGQSGIYDNTDLSNQIDTMDEKAEYIVYFDHFGYVRAYELATKPQYALVTEIYGNNVSNGNLINTNSLTIELSIPNSDTSVEKKEYIWNNPNDNLRALQPWTTVRSTVGDYEYYNYLQPAISHLGVTRTDLGPVRYAPAFAQSNGSYVNWTFWSAALQRVKVVNAIGQNAARTEISGEFDYGSYQYGNSVADTTPVTTSFTNIGVASVQDGKATVTGAAQLKLNKDGTIAVRPVDDLNGNGKWDAGERARYAVDYVQLSTDDVVAKSVRYAINSNTSSTYVADNNYYVNAVDTTEYYIVYNGNVAYFKGFNSFPGLTNEDNNIHAAYAVARDTSADNAGQPYWVADVIVYEVESLTNTDLTSVALAYYTPSRTSGSVQQINTINNKYGLVQLTPGGIAWNATSGQWGNDYAGYGFYELYNDTAPVDNVMSAARIARIQNSVRTDGNYGKNNIHAGIVTRVTEVVTGGAYIDVATNYADQFTTSVSLEVTDQIYSVTTDQAQSDNWYGYNEASLLRYSNIGSSQVKVGDLVIWVGEYKTGSNTVKSKADFVVDLGNTLPTTDSNSNLALFNATPSFLVSGIRGTVASYDAPATTTSTKTYGEWQNIMDEQAAPKASGKTATVTIHAYDRANGNYLETLTFDLLIGSNMTITQAQLNNVNGYTLYGIYDDEIANVPGTGYVGATALVSGGNLTVTGSAGVGSTWSLSYTAVTAADKATYYAVFDKDAYSISVTGGTAGSGLVKGAYVASITSATLAVGDSFSFDITVPSRATNDYPDVPVTATGTTPAGAADTFTWNWVNDTTIHVEGKAYANVTITVATPTVHDIITFNATGSVNVSYTFGGAVIGSPAYTGTGATSAETAYAGRTVTVSVTPDSGYDVFGVRITRNGQPDEYILASQVSDNVYTVPSRFMTSTGTVTVTALTYSTVSNISVSVTDNTTANVSTLEYALNGGTPNTLTSSISMLAGQTVTITANAPIDVRVTAPAGWPNATVEAQADTENMTWVITGIYDAGYAITVTESDSYLIVNNTNVNAVGYSTSDGKSGELDASTGVVMLDNMEGKTITFNSSVNLTVTGSGTFDGTISGSGTQQVTVAVTNGGTLTIS